MALRRNLTTQSLNVVDDALYTHGWEVTINKQIHKFRLLGVESFLGVLVYLLAHPVSCNIMSHQ